MDIGTHLLTGIVAGILLYTTHSPIWYLVILGSILPDLIGETFYQLGNYIKTKKFKIFYDQDTTESSKALSNSVFLYPYNFMHSFFSIIVFLMLGIPAEFILGHAIHILMDILSHSKNSWGIMVFWPFSTKRSGPEKNWWEWEPLKGKRLLWFNVINYLIVLTLLYAIFELIREIG